jgi:hypothetical protein
VAENVLRGVEPSRIVSRLVEEGLDEASARAVLDAVASAPELHGAARALVKERRLELVARLMQELETRADDPKRVPRVSSIAAARFYDSYYAANRPVLIEGYASAWPAMKWTFDGLRERFGEVEVSITTGREGDPSYDIEQEKHREKMALGEVIARIEREPESNDFYMVAQGKNADLPDLAPLFDDFDMSDGILDPDKTCTATALWLGPGGTFTPPHHDTCNVLFVQIVGRKRFVLASPYALSLHTRARAMYVVDPEGHQLNEPGFGDDVLEKEVVLDPGDALFIPVGWWHSVVALEPSVSFGFANFRGRNTFDWFRPGSVR